MDFSQLQVVTSAKSRRFFWACLRTLLGVCTLTVGLLAVVPMALAQDFVFTTITTSTSDDLNGSTINAAIAAPAIEGDYVVFRSVNTSSVLDGIWAYHIPSGGFHRLAGIGDAAPGGTGTFINFGLSGTSLGGPVLRDGMVVFGAVDQGSNPNGFAAFGVFSVPVTGGTIKKIANYSTPVPGAPTNFFDFGEDSRIFGSISQAGGVVTFEGTFGGGPIGGIGLYDSPVTGGTIEVIGDSNHPWNPLEPFPVKNFSNPATNGSGVALVGGTVFGNYGLFYSALPSAGAPNFNLLVGPNTPLPNSSAPNDDTRIITPSVQISGNQVGFIGRDISSDTLGIYRTSTTGGAIQAVVTNKSSLPGITLPNSNSNPFSYAMDGANTLFLAYMGPSQQGLFYQPQTGARQFVADGSLVVDGVPAYDLMTLTPYALDSVHDRFVFTYGTITFPRSVMVLATRASGDSDNDGVTDGQERVDGSDIFDDSSFTFHLERSFCADWNGFLGLIYNIAEFTNFTNKNRNIESMLFNVAGQAQSSLGVDVFSGAQSDVLVHDMTGFHVDDIGTVCSEISNGVDGDIDGRMLQYRPDGLGNFDFVLAMPFTNPLTGPQFVPYNTFHPSLDPADVGFFAADWVTIANTESVSKSGTVFVYAQDGGVLLNKPLTISGDGRYDFPVHEFGPNRIGLVEWRPNDGTARFRVTLNRYIYAGATSGDRVTEAVSLQAFRGSRQTLIAPVDTRGLTAVLEISNTQGTEAQMSIVVKDSAGNEPLNTELTLAPYATQHFILDPSLVSDLGLARVTAKPGSKVIVTAMEYGRTPTAGISNIYPVPAREALGTVMQGSYNTFLQQGCSLLLGNLRSSPETVTIDMTRYDGTHVLVGQQEVVPANGVFEFNLCSKDIADVFGVVRVQSTNQNAIVGNVVRLGLHDNYRIATPVR